MSKAKKSVHSSEGYSSTTCSSSSPSSDEEIDARDSKPIKDYMGDRREMARQLLKSVKAEKVRMMLPQTLKKVDFNELEELCASELSGMSKARILSILNGKPMLESSDTSESDDSGPSLEIISDTEEWLTDDDTPKKSEGKLQVVGKTKIKKEKKAKAPIEKKNNTDKMKVKLKNNIKEENIPLKESQIKKEGEKDVSKNKEKEGDSLLDLLELEMRARAIRALIRNEEDIIPEQSAKAQAHKSALKDKAAQEEIKAKENCRRQLEKIITSKTSTGEDEDVVLVVQPTPTIELLSSESDEEGHGKRINQKLQNERVLETQHGASLSSLQNTQSTALASNSQASKDKEGNAHAHKNKDKDDGNCPPNAENSKSSSDNRGDVLEKKRKLKRKFQSKESEKVTTGTSSKVNSTAVSDSLSKRQDETSLNEENCKSRNVNNESGELKKEKKVFDNVVVKEDETASVAEQSNAPTPNISKKFIIEDDRSADMDEIIDLDDYSDDMDDLDCDDPSKKKTNVSPNKLLESDKNKFEQKVAVQKSGSTETWATRYYQTDDVQSVIKESKIQSEIRKRLRERQRLSKMTKSPNVKTSCSSISPEAKKLTPEQKPTGSVEEYLALKRNLPGNSGTDSNDGNASECSTPGLVNCNSDGPEIDLDKTSVKEVELSSSTINQTEAIDSTNNDMRPD